MHKDKCLIICSAFICHVRINWPIENGLEHPKLERPLWLNNITASDLSIILLHFAVVKSSHY